MTLQFTQPGRRLVPGEEPFIAAGVRGMAFDMISGIYIPLVIADKPGSGDVSRMLDALPRTRRVVFSSVLSDKLHAMLNRRGFRPVWDAESECYVMERLPAREPV